MFGQSRPPYYIINGEHWRCLFDHSTMNHAKTSACWFAEFFSLSSFGLRSMFAEVFYKWCLTSMMNAVSSLVCMLCALVWVSLNRERHVSGASRVACAVHLIVAQRFTCMEFIWESCCSPDRCLLWRCWNLKVRTVYACSMYVCMCVCMYVCMSVCMYHLCMYACMYVICL
jgi:hypothetical protein